MNAISTWDNWRTEGGAGRGRSRPKASLFGWGAALLWGGGGILRKKMKKCVKKLVIVYGLDCLPLSPVRRSVVDFLAPPPARKQKCPGGGIFGCTRQGPHFLHPLPGRHFCPGTLTASNTGASIPKVAGGLLNVTRRHWVLPMPLFIFYEITNELWFVTVIFVSPFCLKGRGEESGLKSRSWRLDSDLGARRGNRLRLWVCHATLSEAAPRYVLCC